MLTWINWPTGIGVRTAADIPTGHPAVNGGIDWSITALVALPGLLCLRGYRLNRRKLQEIQAALRATA